MGGASGHRRDDGRRLRDASRSGASANTGGKVGGTPARIATTVADSQDRASRATLR